jgi:hypothetical protein
MELEFSTLKILLPKNEGLPEGFKPGKLRTRKEPKDFGRVPQPKQRAMLL